MMPLKCSVVGCKSNYNSNSTKKYISVFKFPADESLREEWLKTIPRSNWSPGPAARVCELHFDSKFISRIEEFIHNGEKKTFPRKRPLLSPLAIPTIFPNLPSYLSSAVTPKRANGEKRRKFVADQHEKSVDEFFTNDKILNFETLKNGYQKYVNSPLWKFDISDTFVAYIPDFPKIAVCIQINANLEVTVYRNGFVVPINEFNWLIYDTHLTLFSQFENLLNRLAVDSTIKPSQNKLQETILSCWDQLIEFFNDDEESLMKRKKLRSLREQFSLAMCNPKVSRR